VKVWLSSIIAFCLLAMSQLASAQTVIYQDDFEGTVSGWTNNQTDFDPDVTRFLGRFDNNPTSTSRTFTVPANTDELVIEFDLYRFDSWDNNQQFGFDRFEIDIDGSQIFSVPFPNPQAARSGSSGNVDWEHSPITGRVELAFNSGQFWFDQLHRYRIVVNNPGPTVALTLRADLTQGGNDESAGYDNFLVTVPGTEITAVAENFTTIDGTSGGVTTSVLASDTLDNQPVNPNDVTLTVINSSSPNVVLDPATGLITVAAGTTAGFYTVEYEICENANLSNCSSVTETITVKTSAPGGGGGVCPIGTVAVPGTYHVVSATDHPFQNQNAVRTVGQPLAEGAIATDNNTALTFFGAITMDLTGDPNILAPEGSVIEIVLASHFGPNDRAEILMSADGVNYTSLGTTGDGGSVHGAWPGQNILRYDDFTVPPGGARFVQVLKEDGGIRADGVIYDTQCQPAVTAPVIVAADDSETVPSLLSAQTNVLNVIDNDTFDGNLPTSFDLAVNTSTNLPPELTFDTTTGEVGVVAGTAAGVYSFDYDICEVGTTNCDTATVTITVEVQEIEAVAETFTAINGANGGTTTSVLASDTLNGIAVNATDVTITVGTSDPELTLDPATGLISVAAGTSAGTYTVDYTICENLNPTNCSTITETVTVEAAPIIAVAETFPAFNGVNGGVTTSVLASDTLNGSVLDPNDVTITTTTPSSPNVTLDPATGLITIAAGTAAGTYTVDYTICEDLNPSNCSTITETVTVEAPTINAVAEIFPVIDGESGGITSSVLVSDTLNGTAVNAADVTITVGATDPELTLDPVTGLISVAAGTAAGTYTVDYTICENLNPSNCSNVTETVIVEVPAPSLSMTKVADNIGPFTVGDIITYTYTVTNDGDQIIRDVAITDTHNGSDPAPVPGNEVLLTDAAPVGDSTDATVDGSWDALAPGDIITFSGTYTVTQTDVENL